jgi:hypothetical protein
VIAASVHRWSGLTASWEFCLRASDFIAQHLAQHQTEQGAAVLLRRGVEIRTRRHRSAVAELDFPSRRDDTPAPTGEPGRGAVRTAGRC